MLETPRQQLAHLGGHRVFDFEPNDFLKRPANDFLLDFFEQVHGGVEINIAIARHAEQMRFVAIRILDDRRQMRRNQLLEGYEAKASALSDPDETREIRRQFDDRGAALA